MTLDPSIRPRTAKTPDVSVACRPTTVPSSSRAANRTSGSRGSMTRGPGRGGGSAVGAAWFGVAAVGAAAVGVATDPPVILEGSITAVTVGTPDAPVGRYERMALTGRGAPEHDAPDMRRGKGIRRTRPPDRSVRLDLRQLPRRRPAVGVAGPGGHFPSPATVLTRR